MSDYDPLFDFLKENDDKDYIILSFEQIEKILGKKLPQKAYSEMQRWENSKSHTQARAWLNAGWWVQHPREVIKSGEVKFIKLQSGSDLKKLDPTKNISISLGKLIYMILMPIIPLGYYFYYSAGGTSQISKFYLKLFFISLGVGIIFYILTEIF